MFRAVFVLLFLFTGCIENSQSPVYQPADTVKYETAGAIPPPEGFTTVALANGSFGEWLRRLPFKKDNTVYLYNGRQKANQSAQYAVIDLPVGNKNLQQCADALLHLKTLYFFESNMQNDLRFTGTDGTIFSFAKWKLGERYKQKGDRLEAYQGEHLSEVDSVLLKSYLENVYTWCGTYSLYKETTPLSDKNQILPGDVFVRAGSPGHAMLVVNVAENKYGEKAFMLLQSYMPAQEMHIVKNPLRPALSPWYILKENVVVTPEWRFTLDELRRWKL